MDEISEVMLRGWYDGPRGRLVTFELRPEGAHPFRDYKSGKNGDRFAIAVVKINDDESMEKLNERKDC